MNYFSEPGSKWIIAIWKFVYVKVLYDYKNENGSKKCVICIHNSTTSLLLFNEDPHIPSVVLCWKVVLLQLCDLEVGIWKNQLKNYI